MGADLWSDAMTEFTKDVKCWNQEKDGNGNWISEDQALESLVTNFYKDLYLDNGIVIPYALNNASPPLEEN
ncbi:hypothetical protein JHK87_047875 [Glycine soja]|nr:hypothetical protein JHK87_047875 [Glycine soja]